MSKGVITRLLLVGILLTAMLAATGCTKEVQVDATIEENYVAVETEKVVQGSISNTTRFSGKIVANDEIMVMPKTMGIVNSVNVKLGDRVEKDAILFILDQEDISKSVMQAENSLSLARKSVEQALNSLNTAKINFELNKEKLDNASLSLERNKELYALGAISKSQLEQAEMAASDKQIDVAQGQVRQAEIAYQQSQGQLRQAEISYSQALGNYDNAVVRAPIAGVVSALNVKAGQIASSSQAAVVLVNAESVYMQLNVVEGVVNKLQLGQEVMVNVPAALDGPIPAIIDYISPTADSRSQLYPVKIYLDNTNQSIRPGMNGEARLSVDKIDSAIVVKSSAVLDKNGNKIVYVLQENKAVEKIVSVGLDTGDLVEIKSGLKVGEEIIVKGQHYVENDQTVKVVRGE